MVTDTAGIVEAAGEAGAQDGSKSARRSWPRTRWAGINASRLGGGGQKEKAWDLFLFVQLQQGVGSVATTNLPHRIFIIYDSVRIHRSRSA